MYALGFLKERSEEKLSTGAVEVEYRLVCSGELYNRNVKTGDWRKSGVARILLRTPFELFVASEPFEDYPQELCARLVVTRASESDHLFARGFLPDKDVIEDLCSLLTLLSRRQTPFFQKLRSDFVLYLYSNPAIWPLFGYEGPSNDKGGYLHRGFNDIDWIKREEV